MRLLGGVRTDTSLVTGTDRGLTIAGNYLVGSDSMQITGELAHAIAIDYAFFLCKKLDQQYSVHAVINRRKAIRRIIHIAGNMHKIIDQQYGRSTRQIFWRQPVYDFTAQKFVILTLQCDQCSIGAPHNCNVCEFCAHVTSKKIKVCHNCGNFVKI